MLPISWVETATKYGQQHLLQAAQQLSGETLQRFEQQLLSLNFSEFHRLYEQAKQKELSLDFTRCEAPEIIRLPRTPEIREAHSAMKALGEEL